MVGFAMAVQTTPPCEIAGELRWSQDHTPSQNLPLWARWFVAVGGLLATAHVDEGLRHWTVVTVPHRAFAALLVAHGAIKSMLQESLPIDVWERFESVAPGDPITWIDSNGDSRFGQFVALDSEQLHYRSRVHGGWSSAKTSVLLSFADSYWPAPEMSEFVSRPPVADHPEFAASAMGVPVERFLAVSQVDAVLVGVRSELAREISTECFAAVGPDGAEVVGSLLDTVRPRELVGLGQHFRSVAVSALSDTDDIETMDCGGPVIFDGPGGYLRHRDLLNSMNNIVVLDRWDPRAEDAAIAAQLDRGQTWVDVPMVDLPTAPPGVEVYRWTGVE